MSIYLPKDTWYDWATYAPVQGAGASVSLTNVTFTTIPLHIRSGAVLPLRATSANTTTALRTKPFEFVIAQNSAGKASGSLYLDDGVSIVQQSGKTTSVTLAYSGGELKVAGTFAKGGRDTVSIVSFLGVSKAPAGVKVNGKQLASASVKWDAKNKVVRAQVNILLTSGFTVSLN